MSAAPMAAEAHAAPAPPYRWIVSARYDGFFFLGSCVLTLAFFALYRWADSAGFAPRGDAILLTYFLFTAFFDHPHILQTFSRTHFDSQERAKHAKTHTYGLAAFVCAGLLIHGLGYDAELIAFAAIYGTWHIIRQHWGLIRAYKALNGDHEPIDDALDAATFYTGTFACFCNDYADIRGPVVVYGELRAHCPSLPQSLGLQLWSVFLVLLVLFGLRQTWRVMEGKRINLPKCLLMATALTTHYFVFFATATPFLIAEALETVYHDVQYQGWIMHYQRKRYPHVRGVVGKWLAVGLAYGLFVGTIEILGLLRQGWAMWLFTPFSMVVIYHYYVDGKIWRFREDPELRRLLLPRDEPAAPVAAAA